jgi:hypothetical protein
MVLNLNVTMADKVDDKKDSWISLTNVRREDTFKSTAGNQHLYEISSH